MADRLLLIVGILGPIVFALLALIGALVTPSYSQLDAPISALGAVGSRAAWLQQLNFAVLGLSQIALGVGLRRSGVRFGAAIPLLIGVAGVFTTLVASAPCSPGCPDVFSDSDARTTDVLHTLWSVAGFLCWIVAPFLGFARFRSGGSLQWFAWTSLGLGVVSVVAAVAYQVASDPAAGVYAGGWQRALVGSTFAWLITSAAVGLRVPTEVRRTPD